MIKIQEHSVVHCHVNKGVSKATQTQCDVSFIQLQPQKNATASLKQRDPAAQRPNGNCRSHALPHTDLCWHGTDFASLGIRNRKL